MEITVGHLNPVDSAYQRGSLVFKRAVESFSKGHVRVRVLPRLNVSGGQLIQAVRAGKLDIGVTASGPIGELVPETNAFDFPYLFKSRKHAYKVLDGEIGNEVNRAIRKIGLRNLAWWENGFRHITTTRRPIRKPSDLKGLKFRTLDNPIYQTLFRLWGTELTSIPFPALYAALKNGRVHGQENPLGFIIPNRFYEVQRYLTLTGHTYSPALFVMNASRFERLPVPLRKIILQAAKLARDYERNYLRKNEMGFLRTAQKGGMCILTKKDIDLSAFVRTSREVYARLGKPYEEIHRRIRLLSPRVP